MTHLNLPAIVFVGLVLAAGVFQGLSSERWQSSASVDEAVRRLDRVPLSFGGWRGESRPIDDESLVRAGIKGHVSTRYRNTTTGDVVSALIVCGRPGPISVHTPDVCYGAAGYVADADMRKKEISMGDGRKLSVWAQSFKAPAAQAAAQIEVNWVWMAGTDFVAPDNSRLSFAGFPAIYKVYVVRELSALESKQKRDPGTLFLHDFLPELEKVLAPAASH